MARQARFNDLDTDHPRLLTTSTVRFIDAGKLSLREYAACVSGAVSPNRVLCTGAEWMALMTWPPKIYTEKQRREIRRIYKYVLAPDPNPLWTGWSWSTIAEMNRDEEDSEG